MLCVVVCKKGPIVFSSIFSILLLPAAQLGERRQGIPRTTPDFTPLLIYTLWGNIRFNWHLYHCLDCLHCKLNLRRPPLLLVLLDCVVCVDVVALSDDLVLTLDKPWLMELTLDDDAVLLPLPSIVDRCGRESVELELLIVVSIVDAIEWVFVICGGGKAFSNSEIFSPVLAISLAKFFSNIEISKTCDSLSLSGTK